MGEIGKNVRPDKFGFLKNLALVTQLGLSMALPLVAGVYIGAKLDNYFNTGPILLLLCLLIFGVGSFMNMFRLAGIRKKKKNLSVKEDSIDKPDSDSKSDLESLDFRDKISDIEDIEE